MIGSTSSGISCKLSDIYLHLKVLLGCYDKRENYNFPIENFLFICSNILVVSA